jgi:hypothetical protein
MSEYAPAYTKKERIFLAIKNSSLGIIFLIGFLYLGGFQALGLKREIKPCVADELFNQVGATNTKLHNIDVPCPSMYSFGYLVDA